MKLLLCILFITIWIISFILFSFIFDELITKHPQWIGDIIHEIAFIC